MAGLVGGVRQIRAALGLAALLILALPWFALSFHPSTQRRIGRTGWKILLAAFGIELIVRGKPHRNLLLVANHVSWIDIPALALVAEVPFVAKAEVGRWPVVGPLARRLGCVFVERERRLGAKLQAGAIRSQLHSGGGLILFPEGTTGMGWTVLPFRSSLFVGADGDWVREVQPVVLRYLNRDGSRHQPDQRRRVAWLDDDALLPHAFALAASGGTRLELVFAEPLRANCRKELANLARESIASVLADTWYCPQAAALKRAA